MKSADEILALYQSRLSDRGPLFQQMAEVREVYNGDIVVPLPTMGKTEKSAVANLTQQGLDQLARRSNSVKPNMVFPPLRPGIKASEELADKRRMVTYGWHGKTRLNKVNNRRNRWYYGYGEAPVVIRPNPKYDGPCWEPVVPLDCFPAPRALDSYEPDDSILRHKRAASWVEATYDVRLTNKSNVSPDTMLEVLEYIDAEEIVAVVLVKGDPALHYQAEKKTQAILLDRMENRAEMPLVVVPGRMTLDRLLGHFDGIIGQHITQAELMALEVLATRRGIVPREWLVANPGQAVQIIQKPDPSTGTPGVLQGGTLQEQHIDPSFQALQVIDRLEASQRMTAGIPAEFGGFSQSDNVRTARRGGQVMGAAIDFTIAESQDIFAESLYHENVRAQAIDKGWYGGKKKSMYVSTKGARGHVTYVPNEVWETKEHIVEYPLAGTDLNDLVINGGQRIGQETMSHETFMEIDPLVDDVEAELRRIAKEKIANVFFAGAMQQIADPTQGWSLAYFAEFAQRIDQGEEWYDAFVAMQKEVQEKQAAGAQAPPEGQPGMMEPGQGGELPTVPEEGPSMQNMQALLGGLGVTDQALRMR